MRRLLIVAASALVLATIGIGAAVALRGETGAAEPQAEPHYVWRIGPTMTTIRCGEPPYKPCPRP
jgi:hypothetical protein